MRPDGTGVEMPIGPGRARGRSLSDAGATRVRDLLLTLLRDALGLSVPDALAVLGKLDLSRSQLYDRLGRCPRLPRREILARLLGAAESESDATDAA